MQQRPGDRGKETPVYFLTLTTDPPSCFHQTCRNHPSPLQSSNGEPGPSGSQQNSWSLALLGQRKHKSSPPGQREQKEGGSKMSSGHWPTHSRLCRCPPGSLTTWGASIGSRGLVIHLLVERKAAGSPTAAHISLECPLPSLRLCLHPPLNPAFAPPQKKTLCRPTCFTFKSS